MRACALALVAVVAKSRNRSLLPLTCLLEEEEEKRGRGNYCSTTTSHAGHSYRPFSQRASILFDFSSDHVWIGM